jgi:hypothetical protein
LVKPSHYDDDGYVIRWWRAMIPSNSLAALYGIADDCVRRQVLGPNVAFDIEAIDEMNTRIDIPRLIARMREHNGFGLVALVGVQSNQYPRALDIARPFREAGYPGRHRRVPRLGLPIDAGWLSRRTRRLSRVGHCDVRG